MKGQMSAKQMFPKSYNQAQRRSPRSTILKSLTIDDEASADNSYKEGPLEGRDQWTSNTHYAQATFKYIIFIHF